MLDARAREAATAGIQATVTRLAKEGGCGNWSVDLPTGADALAGCRVSVKCTQVELGTETFYDVVSTGTCGSGLEQARRILEARMR